MKKKCIYITTVLLLIVGCLFFAKKYSKKAKGLNTQEILLPEPNNLELSKDIKVTLNAFQDSFTCYVCITWNNTSNNKIYVPNLKKIYNCLFFVDNKTKKPINFNFDYSFGLQYSKYMIDKESELNSNEVEDISKNEFDQNIKDSIQKVYLNLFPTNIKKELGESRQSEIPGFIESSIQKIVTFEPHSTLKYVTFIPIQLINNKDIDIFYNYPGIINSFKNGKNWIILGNIKNPETINDYKLYYKKILSDTCHLKIACPPLEITLKQRAMRRKYMYK
jgi:hypothetical protein